MGEEMTGLLQFLNKLSLSHLVRETELFQAFRFITQPQLRHTRARSRRAKAIHARYKTGKDVVARFLEPFNNCSWQMVAFGANISLSRQTRIAKARRPLPR